MSNYAISENSRYHGILMKHLVPAEAGTLFRRSYIFQLGALFCIAMPNNAYKYLLLSHFLFAKWPLRGWPDFGSILCHSSYRCTCFPLDQVQKHILYIVAYSIFGAGGRDMWQTWTQSLIRGWKCLTGCIWEWGYVWEWILALPT